MTPNNYGLHTKGWLETSLSTFREMSYGGFLWFDEVTIPSTDEKGEKLGSITCGKLLLHGRWSHGSQQGE